MLSLSFQSVDGQPPPSQAMDTISECRGCKGAAYKVSQVQYQPSIV